MIEIADRNAALLQQLESLDRSRSWLALLEGMYADVVRGKVPPDVVVSRWRRRLPDATVGPLSETLVLLLRYRLMALTAWLVRTGAEDLAARAAAGDVPASDTAGMPDPLREAHFVFFVALREELGLSGREAASRAQLSVEEIPRLDLGPGSAELPAQLARAIGLSLPEPLAARWAERLGDEPAGRLAAALRQTAPRMVRANALRGTREALATRLGGEGILTTPCRFSPHGLALDQRLDLRQSAAFQEGYFEYQDEASQLVSLALDPRPTWRVLDACAGAGGKSLHLAAIMKGKGGVFAHDINGDRLEESRERVRRSTAQNVRLLEPGGAAAVGPFDGVLVDAPCLGLGTLRRNPDLAWRGDLGARLSEVKALQRDCLTQYAPLVRPGGVLLYATCSFEPEETDLMADWFEGEFPEFSPSPLAGALKFHGIKGLAAPGAARLTMLPHEHDTDGFYMARWERKA